MGVNSRPPFFMPLFRTSVRYKGSRCDCVRVAYSINRHRFILLTAHSSLRPRCPLLLSPRFLSSYVRPVRLACRLVEHLVMRLVSCVLLCRIRLSCRLTCSSRRFISLVVSYGRRSALLFARSRFACRGGLALRSRAVSFRLGISFVISSRPPFRSVSPVGVSDPFSCLVLVFAPFCPAVRSFLFVLFGIGSCSWSWGVAVRHGHGAAGACSSHLIRPIIMPARYSLTRCGMALWEDVGYGAPFRVARRSSLARSCPIVLLITSDLPRPHCVLSFPHPRSKKAGSGSGGEGGIEQER